MNKGQIVFLSTVVMFGIIIFTFQPMPEVGLKKDTGGKESSYQPTSFPSIPYLPEQFETYLATYRNPFGQRTVTTTNEAELGLISPIVKRPVYNLFTPFPGGIYYNNFIYTLPVEKTEYRYAITPLADKDLPNSDDLFSAGEINQLISDTQPKPVVETKKQVDPFPDYIFMDNDTKIKGKVLKEDDQTVYFQEAGKNFYRTFDKNKVKTERTFSPEEKYAKRAQEIKSSRDAGVHYELVEECLQDNLFDQALAELRITIKLNNTQLNYYLKAGELTHSQMKLDEELAFYQQALAAPIVKKELIYLRLADLYRIIGRPEDVIDALKKAVGNAPTDPVVWLKLSYAYYETRDYQLAEESYKKGKQFSPLDPSVTILEGLLYFKKGNLAAAQTSLKDAVDKIKPEGNKPVPSTMMAPEEITAALGVVNTLLKDYKTAQNYFRQAITANSSRAAYWVNLACLYLLAGDAKNARLILDEAANRDPSSPLPLLARGYLSWSQNRLDETSRNFNAAAKVDPDNPLVLYARGTFLYHIGKPTEAGPVFTELIRSKSPVGVIEALYYLGLIAYDAHRFSNAVAYFKTYLNKLENRAQFSAKAEDKSDINKPFASDYTMAGLACLAINQLEPAQRFLEQALDINPNYIPALNGQAYLEYQNKDPKEAIKKFQKVLTLSPNEEYAVNSLKAIQEAESQSVWVDRFNRENGLNIGEGWSKKESYGIEIAIADEKLRFSGTQSLLENGLTSLDRSVDVSNFTRFDVNLITKDINHAAVGIYLAVREERLQGALFYGLIPSGDTYKPGWQITGSPDSAPTKWNNLPNTVSTDNILKLSFQKTFNTGNQPEIKICLNDSIIGTIPSNNLRSFTSAKTYLIGIFGCAPVGTKWQLSVTSVKVTEKVKK